MKRIALKIDVDTCRGTLFGVPALIELLQRHEASGSFFFSLGPDTSGREARRSFAEPLLRSRDPPLRAAPAGAGYRPLRAAQMRAGPRCRFRSRHSRLESCALGKPRADRRQRLDRSRNGAGQPAFRKRFR
jgi:hypothetical protein